MTRALLLLLCCGQMILSPGVCACRAAVTTAKPDAPAEEPVCPCCCDQPPAPARDEGPAPARPVRHCCCSTRVQLTLPPQAAGAPTDDDAVATATAEPAAAGGVSVGATVLASPLYDPGETRPLYLRLRILLI